QWLIGDRETQCSVTCLRTQGKPVCGSDGWSYDTGCDFQKARCKNHSLSIAHRGRCKGKAIS
ncbi:SMOC1 protein, partial [Atractosteus spatula]|nr:SMOC1 protein [Atractosteus spatula]